ncbi:MAG: glycosyltransferase family 4 protein [Candidatus Micrarchaeaceae archaeon]
MKIYDYVFVLNDIVAVKHPAGGVHIIFTLANHLASLRHKVAILSITTRKLNNIEKLAPLLMSNNFILTSWAKAVGSDYNYSLLKNIDVLFDNGNFDTKRLFACAWQCSDYVNTFKNGNAKKYQILQNDEASDLFSGESALQAKEAYSYKRLQKIVISEDLQNKYKAENPLRFQDYVDDIFQSSISPEKRNRYTIFMALRQETSKGSDYAIATCEELRNKYPYPFRFIAFGNIEKSKVPDYIEYYYKPTNKRLIKLYNEASIFISTSLIEGFSLIPAQAMACGCATIISNSGGIREFAKDGDNSFIVPIKDSKAMADKVISLITDDNTRCKLANSGIETIKNNFKIEDMFKSWDTLSLS